MALSLNSIERVAEELGVTRRTVERYLTDHAETIKVTIWPGRIKRHYLTDEMFEKLKIEFNNRPHKSGWKNAPRHKFG